jgi:hypothetical protein
MAHRYRCKIDAAPPATIQYPTSNPIKMSTPPLVSIPGLKIEYYCDGIIISGRNTFDYKEQLKALGGVWDAPTRQWALPPAADLTTIEIVERPPPTPYRKSMTVEERKAMDKERLLAALEKKKTSSEFYWICCDKCTVLSWSSMMTSCMEHAGREGEYVRRRGMIYTGD